MNEIKNREINKEFRKFTLRRINIDERIKERDTNIDKTLEKSFLCDYSIKMLSDPEYFKQKYDFKVENHGEVDGYNRFDEKDERILPTTDWLRLMLCRMYTELFEFRKTGPFYRFQTKETDCDYTMHKVMIEINNANYDGEWNKSIEVSEQSAVLSTIKGLQEEYSRRFVTTKDESYNYKGFDQHINQFFKMHLPKDLYEDNKQSLLDNTKGFLNAFTHKSSLKNEGLRELYALDYEECMTSYEKFQVIGKIMIESQTSLHFSKKYGKYYIDSILFQQRECLEQQKLISIATNLRLSDLCVHAGIDLAYESVDLDLLQSLIGACYIFDLQDVALFFMTTFIWV